jgi:predicted nucleotidyltransferase component of viral defense system
MSLNKTELKKLIEITANKLQMQTEYLEKDYYLTLVLAKINELCPDLVFKGGTCLNKVYFDYHRLSEDLDFSLEFRLPTKEEKKDGFSPRKNTLKKIEEALPGFMEPFSLKFAELIKRDGSRQHNYAFEYTPVFINYQIKPTIKLEIRSRENNIILKPEIAEVKHKFYDPFSNESVMPAPKVKVYQLKELLADKLAAAINIQTPRDFYDIDYALRKNFNFQDKEFLQVFAKKLQDDRNLAKLQQFQHNLGKTDEEIKLLNEKAVTELSPVINISDKKYTINQTLEKFNQKMPKMILDIQDIVVKEEISAGVKNYIAFCRKKQGAKNVYTKQTKCKSFA